MHLIADFWLLTIKPKLLTGWLSSVYPNPHARGSLSLSLRTHHRCLQSSWSQQLGTKFLYSLMGILLTRKKSFKKLLTEERKARLSREKVEKDEKLELQHRATQEIKQAGDSMISAVHSKGNGFSHSLKPNLSWSAFSSLLHFNWTPPIIEFAKAHVESMLKLRFVS